jgi:phosphomevalonate kinase
MKNNENAKERKSFKEVVVENKGKIIAGVSIAAAGVAGAIIVKNNQDAFKALVKQITKADAKADLNTMVSEELWNKVEVTENIIVNSGIIEQARATITRKRDNLTGKLNRYINIEQGTPDIDKLIEEVKAGIKGFDKMLDSCDELEYLYKARTLAENVLED